MKAWSAAVATALVVLIGATGAGAVYAAAPEPSFAMVGSAGFTGTAADGTSVSIGVQVTQAELSPISPAGSDVTAPSGSVFLVVEVESDPSAGAGPSFNGFDAVPSTDVSLHTASGVVAASEDSVSGSGPLSGTYSFVVPNSITTAWIVVGGATISAVEYPGAIGANAKLTELTLAPTTIDLALVKTPSTTTPPSSVARPLRAPRSGGRESAGELTLPGEIAIGAGGGGLGLLVVVVPIVIRRRRYDHADRQGRVVIETTLVLERPPVLEEAPEAGRVEEAAPVVGGIEVAVLGELEFRGLLRPTTSAPVLELLCYLALRPGRSFTAAELRNAIWAEPRTEPSVQSFHNCVSKLRKALPDGTLERSGYRYRLTDAVVSDWGTFLAHTAAEDSRASHLRAALDLVRGRPFSGVGGRDPEAYNWASSALVAPMELAIENATHELVTLALADGDVTLAEWALSRWPPDPPWSLVLEGDALRVAAARSGPVGVGRAFEAARSHLGEEATILGDLAHELGWEG